MTIDRRPMACAKCEREFMGELVMNCPVELAVASMKAVRCPYCWSKKILLLFGDRYSEALQVLDPSATVSENETPAGRQTLKNLKTKK